jgi:hypothetical protein
MVKSPRRSWRLMIAHRILAGAVVPLLAAARQNIGTLATLTESR